MKKIVIVTFVLLVAILFIFYKHINTSFSAQVLPITMKKSPLDGLWVVTKCVLTDNSMLSESDAKGFWGKEAIFSSEKVCFNNNMCKNPNFKIKIVDTKNYFWDSFKVKASDLSIAEKDIKVITLSSGNVFFDDYVKVSDNQIIKNNNGVLLIFTKKNFKNKGESPGGHEIRSTKISMSQFQKEVVSKSGILLGLKCKDERGHSYRTLWISSSYGELNPVKETRNLLVPRKSGFWQIGMDIDTLWGKPLNNNNKYKSRVLVNSEIIFLGNDYVSLDNNKFPSSSLENSGMEVIAIDNLNGDRIAFSKALGNDANEALKKSAYLYLKRLNNKEYNYIGMRDLEKDWAVIRRSGRWILRGRLPSGDFDIAFATPSNLTTYDDLCIPFNVIKEAVPEAIDAYSSPNKDILVVVTNTNLKIFSIDNNKIGVIKEDVKIKNNESVIMAQWATGEYVEEWEKVFIKL